MASESGRRRGQRRGMGALMLTPEDRSWWQRGGFFSLEPSPGMRRLRRMIQRLYRERLTARGRFALGALAVFAVLGVDPRRSQVFVLFAAAAGLLIVPGILALLSRPRVRLLTALPAQLTARVPLTLRVRVENASRRPLPDLVVRIPMADADAGLLAMTPPESYISLGPESTLDVPITIEVARRGQYTLRGPTVAAVDPLRLLATAGVGGERMKVAVYPRFYTIDSFPFTVGRRYQPGGIPLSSHLGDSNEFIGAREYREGDPVRNIHWRSWARRGEPVVKEFQEEYFCRIALVLDTFLPVKPRPGESEAFEAAISVLASIAEHFGHSEHVVDILAAGPDFYEVTAGRSLAYLENILELLAGLKPCHDKAFERVAPHLFDRLARLSTVVAVLLDWDEARAEFLARVKALGTEVQAIIVRTGATTREWHVAAAELGSVTCLTVDDVEHRLAASAVERESGRFQRVPRG